MRTPIFELCSADAGVLALLKENKPNAKVRFYPFGLAPQGGKTPYAVYQNIFGSPENYLNQRPDIDGLTQQVDVYGDTEADVDRVVKAISFAIETHAHITGWGGDEVEPNTKNYRSTFSVAWFVPR